MILTWALGILFVTSLGLFAWQIIAGLRFPLHKRSTALPQASLPPVTVLKPLKGADPSTRKCLESWFQQDYPQAFELCLGVDSRNDGAFALAQDLIASYPTIPAKLVVCPASQYTNSKVNKLIELSRHANHDVWVISDADVTAPPDFLEQTISQQQREDAGMVHCLYRLTCPQTASMQWEAVGVNVDFWSQVLQARQLKPLDFALGAAMVTTRMHVENVGGFETLGSFLADDYHLGKQLAGLGYPIVLSPVVVECVEPASTWKQVWKHQLRWARTIRCCKPVPYFFSILNNLTLWSLLFWIVVGAGENPFSEQTRVSTILGGAAACWGVALFLLTGAVRIGFGLILHRRFTGHPLPLPWWGMIVLKDLLQIFLWGMAFIGNKIDWRGEEFRVGNDGQMVLSPKDILEEGGGLPACFDSSTQPGKRR